MASDIHIVVVNVGALTNGTRPLLKVPSGFGGITLQGAHVSQGGSTNSSLHLVTMGSAGTAIPTGGTLSTAAIGGTAAPFAANTPKDFALTTDFVPENTWLGVKELNVAAMATVANVSLEYVMGK
jgi:hypothetical protein